jgi:hypothetical protein
MKRVRLKGAVRRRPGNPRKTERRKGGDRQGARALTDELIGRFCKLVLRGLPADSVCGFLGLPGSTFHGWMRKGKRFVEGDGEPKEWRLYGEFYSRVRKALARYELRTLDRMHRDGNRLWARDMTILERRNRKSFGRADPQGDGGQSYQADERFV